MANFTIYSPLCQSQNSGSRSILFRVTLQFFFAISKETVIFVRVSNALPRYYFPM
jgi:hypothetical protein